MKKRFILIAVIVLATLFFIGTRSDAASLTGKATYQGEIPKFKGIKMEADPVCLAKHSGEVFPETLVLGDETTKTLGNALVRVTSGLPSKTYPTPTEPFVLTQEGCRYSPHVISVMVGQPIKFLNPDGTLHNLHVLPKINAEFNMAMPQFRKEATKTFDKVEVAPFPIKCDVHPWMGAWITVMNHPFFYVTQPNGQYKIDNLPAGTYEVEAWHEKLPAQKATVTLAEGETKELDFTFSKP
ncbi:MAG: carboxypeptidase regulatory-like domain-containing protein [Candidatus Omnitrophica bacterium]|nr:carboxypeptidase regulatory-like domain-containing protein [Candidatus Omnitrophota bacterium]